MIDFEYKGLYGKNAINRFTEKEGDFTERGNKLAEQMNLKMVDGRYITSYGSKTPHGFYLTVLNMINEIESNALGANHGFIN